MKFLFWLSAGLLLHVYVAYPLLIALIARQRGASGGAPRKETPPLTFSLILTVHNEAGAAATRVKELLGLVRPSPPERELIVVSDGSTDGTVAAIRAASDGSARIIELPVNVGKAKAMSIAASQAIGQILVFADVRQRWNPEAIDVLLQAFQDEQTGAVGGELMLEAADGVLQGVGLYWKYERWIRQNESAVDSTNGLSGAISAVRRSLFDGVPDGIILDDVYWPMRVVKRGYRVRYTPGAVAFDRLPSSGAGEFKRKVRTLSGNFQLLAREPWILLPTANRVWMQFMSHKVLRLASPWLLLGALVSSALLGGALYGAAFIVQCVFYGIGISGMISVRLGRTRVVSAVTAFLLLNAAAAVALVMWITGRADMTWAKVSYSGNR